MSMYHKAWSFDRSRSHFREGENRGFVEECFFPIPKPVVSAKLCKARPGRRCKDYMNGRHLGLCEKNENGKSRTQDRGKIQIISNEGRYGNYEIGSCSSARRQTRFTNLYIGQRIRFFQIGMGEVRRCKDYSNKRHLLTFIWENWVKAESKSGRRRDSKSSAMKFVIVIMRSDHGQKISICSNRHWEKSDLFEDARITRIQGTGGTYTCPKKLNSGEIETRKRSNLESSTAMKVVVVVVESDVILCSWAKVFHQFYIGHELFLFRSGNAKS